MLEKWIPVTLPSYDDPDFSSKMIELSYEHSTIRLWTTAWFTIHMKENMRSYAHYNTTQLGKSAVALTGRWSDSSDSFITKETQKMQVGIGMKDTVIDQSNRRISKGKLVGVSTLDVIQGIFWVPRE